MTDRFKILKERLHSWLNQGGSYQKSHQVFCDSYSDIMYCINLATEAEQLRKKLKSAEDAIELRSTCYTQLIEACRENDKLRKGRDELARGFQYMDAVHKELGIVDLTKETARCRETAKRIIENGNA